MTTGAKPHPIDGAARLVPIAVFGFSILYLATGVGGMWPLTIRKPYWALRASPVPPNRVNKTTCRAHGIWMALLSARVIALASLACAAAGKLASTHCAKLPVFSPFVESRTRELGPGAVIP